MKPMFIAMTLRRYWRMAHDPRTPLAVKALIYGSIAYTLIPSKSLPDWMPVLSLKDSAALVPGIVGLTMALIPPQVKVDHETGSVVKKESKPAEDLIVPL
jgi:uncharacterized membrane protein YkvA (DUF1232 family)